MCTVVVNCDVGCDQVSAVSFDKMCRLLPGHLSLMSHKGQLLLKEHDNISHIF